MNMSKQLSLVHLARSPRAGSGAPPLLMLLHGRGSNEQDLFALAPMLDPRFQIISPRAPHILGPGSYEWFPITFTPSGIIVDPAQAEASLDRLVPFIQEAVDAYDADPERVYLMGFSQGAIMSAGVALTAPERIACAVLMSGRVPAELQPRWAAPDRLAGLPILLVHGTYDNVLPIAYGHESRAILESLPVNLTYREYSMGHEVSSESLEDVTAWLSAQLDAPAP
jgi:phospholipase/carboxylesterase